MENGEEKIKFLASIDDGDQDEIISYNEILDIIQQQTIEQEEDPDCLWIFKDIVGY